MHYESYASLDAMLALETLSRLAGTPVTSVRRVPFVGGHSASGSSFLAIETNEADGPRLVLKQSSPACDWIVRATADTRGREVLAWESGLLDRLPPEITHPILACARDESGWSILMRDVSEEMMVDAIVSDPITESEHLLILDALAALHAAFWEQPEIASPDRGYCSVPNLLLAFSPEVGRREWDHPNPIPRIIAECWDLFWTVAEPDVAAIVRDLFDDPAPLCAALARFPQTVAHGDPRPSNLGIKRGSRPRLILLDWQLTGASVPGIDLAWYLSQMAYRLPIPRETTIARYRNRLEGHLGARLDDAWWQPQLDLSLLGHMLRFGWAIAGDVAHPESAVSSDRARAEFDWWAKQTLAATRWL
jgi:hypothetical protein